MIGERDRGLYFCPFRSHVGLYNGGREERCSPLCSPITTRT
mgnify:CR=1 FL=1